MKEQERPIAEPPPMVRNPQADRDLDFHESRSGPQDVLTEAEAERLTARIGLKLGVIADNTEAVMPIIREAIERQAYTALGYPSHGAYVADRFGDTLARLEAAQRRDVVQELTAAGMSTRAIAPIVGVDQSTVVRDLRSADASASAERDLTSPGADTPGDASASGGPVTGRDGKTYRRRARQERDTGSDAEWVEWMRQRDFNLVLDAIGTVQALSELTDLIQDRRQNLIEACRNGMQMSARDHEVVDRDNLRQIAKNIEALADEWAS